MGRSSYDIGREWEATLAARVGGRVTPGSGNQWHAKLDVGDREFLWSAKATDEDGYRLDRSVVVEARSAARGVGSAGGAWAIGLRIAGEHLVVLELDDFLALLEEDVKYIKPDKVDQLRRRASTPQLLRDEEP